MNKTNNRYSTECNNCENWKYGCFVLAPGTIEQVKRCHIYQKYRIQVSNNWNALGCKNK